MTIDEVGSGDRPEGPGRHRSRPKTGVSRCPSSSSCGWPRCSAATTRWGSSCSSRATRTPRSGAASTRSASASCSCTRRASASSPTSTVATTKARSLSDEEFVEVLAFTQAAFAMAMQFSRAAPGGLNAPACSGPMRRAACRKPLKRPSQARARFTVQAIYDAFVRIWQAQGWERLTTRAVALERPASRSARCTSTSPTSRRCCRAMCAMAWTRCSPPSTSRSCGRSDAPWQERLHHLLRLTLGIDAPELQYYDSRMLALEHQIAELKHHRRVHDELLAAWSKALNALRRLAAAAVGAHGAHAVPFGLRRKALSAAGACRRGEQRSAWADGARAAVPAGAVGAIARPRGAPLTARHIRTGASPKTPDFRLGATP